MAQTVRHRKECPNSPILGTTEQSLPLQPPTAHAPTLAFLSSLAFQDGSAGNTQESNEALRSPRGSSSRLRLVQATQAGRPHLVAPTGFSQTNGNGCASVAQGTGGMKGQADTTESGDQTTSSRVSWGRGGEEQALHLSMVVGGTRPRAEIGRGFFLQSHTKMETNKGETVLY